LLRHIQNEAKATYLSQNREEKEKRLADLARLQQFRADQKKLRDEQNRKAADAAARVKAYNDQALQQQDVYSPHL
jgi:hypothetical protein